MQDLCRRGTLSQISWFRSRGPCCHCCRYCGEVQCVLVAPEMLLNNLVAREMLLSQPYQQHLMAIVVNEASEDTVLTKDPEMSDVAIRRTSTQ